MSGCDWSACAGYTSGAAGQTFAQALQYVAAAQCLITESWPLSASIKDGDQFDMIVVGAGSAGAVLAARLSEVSNWTVLLVEAGGDPPLESIIPAMMSNLIDTKWDWNYTTKNDGFSSQGLKNRSLKVSRGKMLGGCSSSNLMAYVRGNPADYDRWAEEGNVGWDWNTIFPYFLKSEGFKDQDTVNDPEYSPYHNTNGPLLIAKTNYSTNEPYTTYMNAYQELGNEILLEVNGGKSAMPNTYARSHATMYDGHRQSVVKCFLNPVKDRPNLFILKNTLVTKIVFDYTTNTATGIEVELPNGMSATFSANQEVIVSAGAINSPQLLMLSGIGPKDKLEKLGINVISDLPVGKNLMDHIYAPIVITAGSNPIPEADSNFETIKYLYNRSGSLASLPFSVTMQFLAFNNSQNYPDYQVINLYIPAQEAKDFCYTVLAANDEFCSSFVSLNENNDFYIIQPISLRHESRGNVTLVSTNPWDHPEMYSGYFTNDVDLDRSVNAVRRVLQLLETETFRSLNASLAQLNVAACSNLEFNSDEYWRCYNLELASSMYHWSGTCAMGSVVDSELRVRGVTGLRVADASVMPTITSGNTNAPVIMIAERLADLIKSANGILTD